MATPQAVREAELTARAEASDQAFVQEVAKRLVLEAELQQLRDAAMPQVAVKVEPSTPANPATAETSSTPQDRLAMMLKELKGCSLSPGQKLQSSCLCTRICKCSLV